jgi:hypothetical protein
MFVGRRLVTGSVGGRAELVPRVEGRAGSGWRESGIGTFRRERTRGLWASWSGEETGLIVVRQVLV